MNKNSNSFNPSYLQQGGEHEFNSPSEIGSEGFDSLLQQGYPELTPEPGDEVRIVTRETSGVNSAGGQQGIAGRSNNNMTQVTFEGGGVEWVPTGDLTVMKVGKQKMQRKAKKLAFEQGISEQEAMELTQLLLSQEFSEGETESIEDVEMDAVNNDFDAQMAHDNGDEAGVESASQNLSVAMSKLKKIRSRKTAEGLAPELDQAQEEVFQSATTNFMNEQAGNIAPDQLETTFTATRQMMGELAGALTEEEVAAVLNANSGVRTAGSRKLAENSKTRFGVPESEGKLYRSWVNPRYFKSAKGNLYKLSVDPTGMEEGMGTPAPAAPAAAPSGAPAAPAQAAPEGEGQHTLSEQEKQMLKGLLADAETSGRSYLFLLGAVAGFLNDPKIMGIPAPGQETEEFNEGSRQAQVARGGSGGGGAAPAAPAPAPVAASKKKSATNPYEQLGIPAEGDSVRLINTGSPDWDGLDGWVKMEQGINEDSYTVVIPKYDTKIDVPAEMLEVTQRGNTSAVPVAPTGV